ncbi:MAG: ribosome maturation factor RimM [Oscillospiraceae bacterium]|nr:ribosome maturation factor RimM [Oscillospiraceae bacterium]
MIEQSAISQVVMGKIAKTHGISGELKIRPSCDSPAFLANFKTLYINGTERRVLSARPHKNALLVKLDGVNSVEAAMSLLGASVSVPETEAKAALPAGRHYIRDLIGCQVISLDRKAIGSVADVLTLPAHDVYVVKTNNGDVMIPVVDEFVKTVDVENKIITVQLIEGMLS